MKAQTAALPIYISTKSDIFCNYHGQYADLRSSHFSHPNMSLAIHPKMIVFK